MNNEIKQLLDKIVQLCKGKENERRRKFWENEDFAVRGETQWHGIPAKKATEGEPMPVTFDVQFPLWAKLLNFKLDEFYHNPETYLKNYLKIKIRRFYELPDDTPIDNTIPIYLAVGFEASLFGQRVHYSPDKDPWISHRPIVSNLEDLKFLKKPDFFKTKIMARVHHFYKTIKSLVGSEFNVIFPRWIRGPAGVAMYICGYENFLISLRTNVILVHKIMQLITESIIQYNSDRANFLGKGLIKQDLYNDDISIPFLSPGDYHKFILPYEIEICNFYNGIYYWHSCGDITPFISDILQIPKIGLLDIGVSVKDKKEAIKSLSRELPLELRILSTTIQQSTKKKLKEQLTGIVELCKRKRIEKFVIRSSGMDELLGVKDDLEKARIWIDLVREIQD
jgi:uroporphyrinogen-III decarboxylase